jgi:serine/threonine-protein kinase
VNAPASQTARLSAALAGRYRIERELGAGGMATVYLAEDLKHDRKVAIKVLKPELAAVLGAERFVVEIKTTASMSHPHILPLFDSGTADGFLFYVMPYIQGETIRETLNREAQFGVDEAVRIAREVADALDYAHRHGVIHRDIKPENILLHDGRAMVMDFGIALAVSAAAGGRMTETGLSLGTPHYMSPEQATAEKEITARSDQYSLASVLYEMLAGDPPFTASAAQAVIMKIITEQAAPVTERRKNVPPNVAAALAKALEKLPADRFESAAKFAEALGNPAFAFGGATGIARANAAAARSSRRALVAVAAIAVIAAVGWVRAATRTSAATDAPVVRVPLDLPVGEQLVYESGALAISPAGDRLAYVTSGPHGVHTVVRRTDEFAGREIAAAQFNNLTFSPDGKWLAYSIGAQVRKIPADGGASTAVGTLADPRVRGLAWSPLDTIVAGSPGGLWALPAAGGAPRRIVPLDSLSSYNYPIFLEDGRTIAFGYRPQRQFSRLSIVAPGAGVPTIGDLRIKIPIGMLSGRLVYVGEEGTLLAVPLKASTRAPVGDPMQLDDSILAYPRDFGASAVLSASGTLAYVRGLYRSWSSRRRDAPTRRWGWI